MGLLSFIFGCGSGAYHKKDGSWFWKDDRMNLDSKVKLTTLTSLYATAGGSAYYRGGIIDGSDGASFQVLDDRYAKDKNAAYYCDTYRKDSELWLVKRSRSLVIEGADVASFKYIGQRYALDAKRAYYEGDPFPVKDPATFEVLYGNYARDRVSGYYVRLEVKESDGATFEGLNDHYARDRSHVWFSDLVREPGPLEGTIQSVVLKDADPATFSVLEKSYAKDAKHVWHKGKLLKSADAATFAVLDISEEGKDAKDTSAAYFEGKKAK